MACVCSSTSHPLPSFFHFPIRISLCHLLPTTPQLCTFDQRYYNCLVVFCFQFLSPATCFPLMSISPQRSFVGVPFLPHRPWLPRTQVKNQDLPNIWIFPKFRLSFWPWNSLFLLISISLFHLDIYQLPSIKPSSMLLLVLCWFLEDQHHLLKLYLS